MKKGQILRKRIKYLKRLRGKIMFGVVFGLHRIPFLLEESLQKENKGPLKIQLLWYTVIINSMLA